jgi:8-amino-7-oxononanoate synthase
MRPGEWDELARSVLAGLEASHLLRRRAVITPIDSTHVLCDGQRLVNFASNNYLGLTHHPRVIEAVERSLRATGAGSGASALISGFGPAHESAQRRIAQWKGTDAAVLLPSGYQANHAAVQTLAAVAEKSSRPVRFLLDKLCHASLIDAVRASGARWRVFPHNAFQKARRLLVEADSKEIQVVVTESIFSMDGDAADLHGLAKLKAKHPFILLLDEAHASGVYGPAGAGLATELGLGALADVTVLTLSKSIGCVGGGVCGSEAFCAALVNFARAYIYSTNVPSMIAAAAEAAIDVMADEPQLQSRVRELAARVRRELTGIGLQVPSGDSPIIPIAMGSESAALDAAKELRRDGILVLAIRPPTVPRGTSRLRVTLSAAHADQEVQRLIQAITRVVTRAAGTDR